MTRPSFSAISSAIQKTRFIVSSPTLIDLSATVDDDVIETRLPRFRPASLFSLLVVAVVAVVAVVVVLIQSCRSIQQ